MRDVPVPVSPPYVCLRAMRVANDEHACEPELAPVAPEELKAMARAQALLQGEA